MSKLGGFARGYAHAAGACLYLFTLGFWSSRHRGLLRTINAHFGYARRGTPALLPAVRVDEVVSGDAAIQLREEAAALGNVSLLELVVLNKLVRSSRPRSIVEIGTFDGRTTLNLAANAPDDARVYTLDLPRQEVESTAFPLDRFDRYCVEKDRSGSRFLGTDCERKITQLYGDSATFDFGPYRDQTDFVFVDGAHSYEYVLSDSRNALSLLRGGKGIIVWHDYNEWDGVTIALNELYRSDPAFAGLKWIQKTTLAYLAR